MLLVVRRWFCVMLVFGNVVGVVDVLNVWLCVGNFVVDSVMVLMLFILFCM